MLRAQRRSNKYQFYSLWSGSNTQSTALDAVHYLQEVRYIVMVTDTCKLSIVNSTYNNSVILVFSVCTLLTAVKKGIFKLII
jgi:hypothetical protein